MGLTVNRQKAKKINSQPSKTEYFYRQPSNERAKISRQISQISSNDRYRLTKWGHQLVKQAIYTSSGNGGDLITLIIHIQWNPDFSNPQGKHKLVREIGSSRNRMWHQITLNWSGIVWTFAPIATAHLQCARYSLGTRAPHLFQARAPSRKLNKI